jgi:hypothetical protein
MRVAILVGTALCAHFATVDRSPAPAPLRVAAVAGIVFDSLAMRGLAGATVQLVTAGEQATSRSTKSDATGHFEFIDVPIGSYLIGFFHPKLDSLGLTSETKRLDLRVDQPLQTQLSVPSGRTLARTVCGASFVTEESGLLMGYVRGADQSMPRADAKVTVRWAELIIEEGGIRRVVSRADATANATGQFAVCGVPVGAAVLVHAAVGADSSGQFEVMLPSTAFLHRDVFVAPVARTRVRSFDSLPDVELLRGTGRVRGKVLAANRRPVRDARVTVLGTGVAATSNADGEFSLGGLPGGTHSLEVRAIGFAPAQVPVDIVTGQGGAAEVELAAIAVTLDTIRVTAQRTYASRRLLELERRQRMGMGKFFDGKEINKRNPYQLTDLLRTVPGIRLVPGRFGSDEVFMRDRYGHGVCRPEFIVDNVRMFVDRDFPMNSVVPMDDIAAVEVYTNMIPNEFMSRTDCGVIAVTTGGRPAPPKR